jgi:hypothetical protein
MGETGPLFSPGEKLSICCNSRERAKGQEGVKGKEPTNVFFFV